MAKRSKMQKRAPQTGEVKPAEAEEIASGQSATVPWPTIFQALVIAAAILWIYWPALRGDWLWDDDQLVFDNEVVQDPSGLWKIWFDPGSLLDYQPLKFSVVWLQWQLWGAHTLGYHLTNLFLHLAGALLVWRLLSKFGPRLAWLGGLIFAIHPVQVESVAWIAQLKNTLSLPPFLLAMCAWIDFDERGKKRDYLLALGLFLAAMLCKPTMVMFPVVILLYAWWKRGRIGWGDAKAGAPFFVISLALGVVTLWFLHHHAMNDNPVPTRGLLARLAGAGLALSFYFSKCFLPVGLLPIYPRWVVDPPAPAQFLPWPILAAVLVGLWTRRRGWGRHALLGLGFFLANLAPFIGFTEAAYMSFTWVMNYLLYIPIIGLIGLVVAAMERMDNRLPAPFQFYGRGLTALALALLALGSRSYAKMFSNSETLWTYELRHNPGSWLGHHNLGAALFETGRASEAIQQYEQALQLKPDDAMAFDNLGYALMKTGRVPEAMEQFRQALRIYPDYALAHHNLGVALLQTGHLPEAMEEFEQAIRINPDYPSAHNNLGDALQLTGHLPEAIEQFEQAIRINPAYPDAHYNLGSALLQTGRLPEAIDQFEQAVRLKPDYAEAHNNLGLALSQTGRIPEAIEQYEQALGIDPANASAHYNLGVTLLRARDFQEALAQFEQALRVKPDYADAHNSLGSVLWQMGRRAEAIEQFEQSLLINPLDAGTRYNLGFTLQQTGHVPEAIRQYEEALQIKPDFTAARNNLTRLQAVQKTAPAKK